MAVAAVQALQQLLSQVVLAVPAFAAVAAVVRVVLTRPHLQQSPVVLAVSQAHTPPEVGVLLALMVAPVLLAA